MFLPLSNATFIIIDEMGYLPFDDFGAHCFFQLVSRRYERASIIFTSNKSYLVGKHSWKKNLYRLVVCVHINRQ